MTHSFPILPQCVFRVQADTNRNGPSEFNPTGSLEHWSAVEASKVIEVETLVIYGEEEGASGEAAKPFIDGIKHVKCVQMKDTRHMPMYEDPESYWKLDG